MFTHLETQFSIPKLVSQNKNGFRYYSVVEKLYQVIKNYEQEDLVCNFWKEIAGI